ncbi:hypothetical protein TanjilG_29479 [Lupinus angustifolius]|uniref:SHSP domain-containing protein n=1 Tax=Lupinus angustifolius TaxID=3871 RepID=A0A4P1R5B9_LUPAN|nr:PREDICTED: class I heat shock protein-like [Lupinus angustifolius]OIW02703.1 hypothetical protein TanjilG_29479 [Lupinus angustifolius]
MSVIPSFFGTGRSLNFLRNPFARPSITNEVSTTLNSHINWKETTEAHVFKVELPGLKNEDVKVEILDRRVVQISGEWSKDNKEKEKKNMLRHMERGGGKFIRRFRLPENANVNQVKACMENGVLTITVQKEEVKKRYVKLVQIQG